MRMSEHEILELEGIPMETEQYEKLNENWVRFGNHTVPTLHEEFEMSNYIGIQRDRANTKAALSLVLSSITIIICIAAIVILLR